MTQINLTKTMLRRHWKTVYSVKAKKKKKKLKAMARDICCQAVSTKHICNQRHTQCYTVLQYSILTRIVLLTVINILILIFCNGH